MSAGLPWHKHCATSDELGAYDAGEAHARRLLEECGRLFAAPLAFPEDDLLAAYVRGFMVTMIESIAPGTAGDALRQFASHMTAPGAHQAMRLEGPAVERYLRACLRVADELDAGPGVLQ